MNVVLRLFARTRPRDLIGPSDQLSNIRPIIVGGKRPVESGETHPYSLSEFGGKDEDDADLLWRIERDRLNAFNHAFWSDSNYRFMRGKEEVLTHFQEFPGGHEPEARAKEQALSSFYCRWSTQESDRQAAYTAEWNARNRAVIRLAIRRQLRIWRHALRDAFTKY